MKRTRRPRPILAIYTNGKRQVFKRGKSATVANSLVAAVRTIANDPHLNVQVNVTNHRGHREASVVAGRSGIIITY